MRIAVLDIETTGRYPSRGCIVEIGIALLDLETGFISKLFDSLVREPLFTTLYEADRLEHCWIFQNSDLTVDDILQAPAWDALQPKVQKILDTFPVTAYNKAFDLGFLKSRGIIVPRELPCPMIAATPILKLPARFDKGDYKWPSVQECWDFFFPDMSFYNEIHRAYDDADHEARIVLKLFQAGAWRP